MQKNENIVEVARRVVNLKEQLETVTELKEKAFTPCKPGTHYKLDELNDIIVAWSEIATWTRDENHYGYLHIKHYNDLTAKFNLLSRAIINREEFCTSEVVVEACKAVEDYIKKLSKEILDQQHNLDTLYNQFAKDAGVYSFIFKETGIKNIIINKLLCS